MDSEIVFNVGLLLEEGFSKALIQYSKSLSKVQDGFYVLGDNSSPHITLLQFRGMENQGRVIWEKIQTLAEKNISVDFGGLSLEVWNEFQTLWLRCIRTRSLEKLQDQLRATLGDNSYLNGLGDRYEPHSTLLAWSALDAIPPFPINSSMTNRKGVKAYLTLGKSGPQLQYAQCLFKGEMR